MRLLLISLIFFTSISAYANKCEIDKSKINISGLALGKSVLKLKSEHPTSLMFDYENNRANISYVHSNEFKDAFNGTPATSAGYISFDGNTKLIKEFSVSFDHLREFNVNNYKNGLIALYSLPQNGWYKPNSKQNNVFKYSCSDYEMEIYYDPERGSFMIVKEI